VTEQKRRAAAAVVAMIEDGMKVGIGTGSTARFATELLGQRVAQGLRIHGIPTSEPARLLASQCGVPLTTFDKVTTLDFAYDGADEIDADHNLIKGGGGALLREKVVAHNAERFCCIVDQAKVVSRLGRFALPVEVVPFAVKTIERELVRLGAAPALRMNNDAPFVTDNGLWILDAAFGDIREPGLLAHALSSLPGVAEHGLFCGMVDTVIVGTDTGVNVFARGQPIDR
jgi:ribose 5-phosphate isomerase A